MLDVDLTAESAQPAYETADRLGLVVTGEVIGAEIAVRDAVAEHVVGGGEHRGGHGEDGVLGAAAGLQAQELGLQVGVFGSGGGPGSGDQGRLDPGRSLAYAGGT